MPATTAADTWRALTNLRALHPNVRWLPPEKLHLTLVFLGSTDASRVPFLTAAVRDVASGSDAFEVSTGDAGGRVGGRRGGVAWLRLASGGHEVTKLALAVDDAVGTRIYNSTTRPRPHLTVARGVTFEALAVLRESAVNVAIGWTVERIVLFRSYTDRAGSRYEELAAAALRRK